ncbi:hypothetical protein HDZ31DRAFT_70931, partial [Schizophyllum fasciatum]
SKEGDGLSEDGDGCSSDSSDAAGEASTGEHRAVRDAPAAGPARKVPASKRLVVPQVESQPSRPTTSKKELRKDPGPLQGVGGAPSLLADAKGKTSRLGVRLGGAHGREREKKSKAAKPVQEKLKKKPSDALGPQAKATAAHKTNDGTAASKPVARYEQQEQQGSHAVRSGGGALAAATKPRQPASSSRSKVAEGKRRAASPKRRVASTLVNKKITPAPRTHHPVHGSRIKNKGKLSTEASVDAPASDACEDEAMLDDREERKQLRAKAPLKRGSKGASERRIGKAYYAPPPAPASAWALCGEDDDDDDDGGDDDDDGGEDDDDEEEDEDED